MGDAADAHGGLQGGAGTVGSDTGSGNPGEGVDAESRAGGTGYGGLAGSLGVNDDRGFFGGIADFVTENPQSVLGLISPVFGLATMATNIGKALGAEIGPADVVGPGDGDGPERAQVQQIVPTFNPIEDMVGSEYVAYGGVGADQLRRQLFPYMNFNQPTQPGITGLVGQYAGVGQGTGLMTGPFGMSNTQV